MELWVSLYPLANSSVRTSQYRLGRNATDWFGVGVSKLASGVAKGDSFSSKQYSSESPRPTRNRVWVSSSKWGTSTEGATLRLYSHRGPLQRSPGS